MKFCLAPFCLLLSHADGSVPFLCSGVALYLGPGSAIPGDASFRELYLVVRGGFTLLALSNRERFRFPAGRCTMDWGHARHHTVHLHTDHPWRRSGAPGCSRFSLLSFQATDPLRVIKLLGRRGVPEEPGLGFGYDVCRVKRCPDISAILSVRKSPVQLVSHFSAIMSLVLGLTGIQSLSSWITDIILKLQTGVASVRPEELAKVLARSTQRVSQLAYINQHRVLSGTCKDPGSKGFDCGLG